MTTIKGLATIIQQNRHIHKIMNNKTNNEDIELTNDVIDFTKYKLGDGVVADVNKTKIVIKQFKANSPIFTTTYKDLTNEQFNNLFSNKYWNITNLASFAKDNCTGVHMSNIPNGYPDAKEYEFYGIVFGYLCERWNHIDSPMNITIRYPWEMKIPEGKLKNPNRGWSKAGYTVDGNQNLFNLNYPDTFNQITGEPCQGELWIFTKIEDGNNIIDISDNPIIIKYVGDLDLTLKR